jgi:hypothetical protein
VSADGIGPPDFDWLAAADAYGGAAHSLAGSHKIRQIMAAVGITGLPLSTWEIAEVKALRERAANNLAAAEAIEARTNPGWRP